MMMMMMIVMMMILPTQSWKVSLSMVGKLPLTTLLLCRITLSTWALVRGDTAAVVVVVVVDVVVVPDVTVKKRILKIWVEQKIDK